MTALNKGRSPNLDIIRIFALFTVVAVHFFINISFWGVPVDDVPMFILTAMRSFFTVCVPLFIVLTGYLMKNKTLSKKFYLGIVKTLGVYLIASIACWVFEFLILKETTSVLNLCIGILDFTAAPYAWYVEMYIGLFVLIPFLNLAYNNLGSKKQKLVLVLTLTALTALPGVLNIWNFAIPASFASASQNSHYIAIVPDWWSGIYPITYYFIGCWLREYGIGLTARKNALLLAASAAVWGIFNVYRCYPLSPVAGGWLDWGALPQVMNTVLIFGLLLNIKDSSVPQCMHKPLQFVSELTFGAYLLSWISDKVVYTLLSPYMTSSAANLKFFPVATVLSFVLALILSFAANIIYSIIHRIVIGFIKK